MKKIFIFFITSMFVSCYQIESPRTEKLLGTVCSVNAYSDGTKKLYDELFNRLRKINSEFNIYSAESELSKVNSNAGEQAVEVSEDVFYLVKKSLEYYQLSEGAFNIAVGPLVKLWGINSQNNFAPENLPKEAEIRNALNLINPKNIDLIPSGSSNEKSKIFLKEKGMKLDLGGIVKGYATDELVKILKNNNVKKAIIDLGGNVFLYGEKFKGKKWNVGIKNPHDKLGQAALILSVDGNKTVVTSGKYERFFEKDGKQFHHILDPKIGRPVESSLASVTIISDSSCYADALSTSAFVLGLNDFSRIIKFDDSVEYIFMDSDLSTIYASKNLEGKIQINVDSIKEIKFVD